jgi:hypothetical protein
MLLECNGTVSDEVGGAKNRIRRGKEVVRFGDVERKKGMSTGSREIRRTSHATSDCDAICPEYRIYH